jgi:hypothetical protein
MLANREQGFEIRLAIGSVLVGNRKPIIQAREFSVSQQALNLAVDAEKDLAESVMA